MGELGFEGYGVSCFSYWVSKEFVFSDLIECVGEYFLYGLLEGEDGGPFGYDEKLGSGSFHKGLPCDVVITEGKEDDEPKKPTGCFYFVVSFFSFLVFVSIARLKTRGIHVHKFLAIQTIRSTVSLEMTLIL